MASIIINQFNEILSSFLIQIVPLVGNTHYNNIQFFIKINAALPIENFLYYTIECRDKIMNRDESYFSDRTVISTIDVREEKLDEVFRLHDIYIHLDKTSKDNVWDIFQALLILGEDYIKVKYSNSYNKNWVGYNDKDINKKI